MLQSVVEKISFVAVYLLRRRASANSMIKCNFDFDDQLFSLLKKGQNWGNFKLATTCQQAYDTEEAQHCFFVGQV